MENFGFAFTAGWQVVLVGVLLGAGLPAVFAVGIRSLAYAGGGSDTSGADGPTNATTAAKPLGTVLAGACFLVVVLGIVLGLTFILASGFGKELDFGSGIPTLADKS
ncbi:hypothetical protein [Nocardioides lijunqiniae]|uniref:hypothetical protein n=1 Tax=Nocardioides lijunqiniae TaxID=2760832 RepID=UPI001877B6BE|nr:hypothetical protein [Nocardioides lijunqiniae]